MKTEFDYEINGKRGCAVLQQEKTAWGCLNKYIDETNGIAGDSYSSVYHAEISFKNKVGLPN